MGYTQRVLMGCLLLVGFASAVAAQPSEAHDPVPNRFEISGQYARQSDAFDETTNLQHVQRGLNGWATGGSIRLWHGLAATGEISGTTGNYNPLHLFSDPQSSLLVMGGLQYKQSFRRVAVFGDVLGGRGHVDGYWYAACYQCRTVNTSAASFFGGGVDTRVVSYLAARLQIGRLDLPDLLPFTNQVHGYPTTFLRYSAGVVLRF